MARIRSIHPGLTSDEAYMSMSMAAKAAWTPLWMQCDDHGIFEWKPIVLKALIFPADAIDFAVLLEEWTVLGCIMKIEIEGKPYGIVRNFAKYQRPKNPSYRHFKPDNLPADLGKFIGVKGATTPALPQPSGSTTENPPQRKEEGGSEKEEGGEKKGERDARAKFSRSNGKARIPADFRLTDRDIDAAHSAGMTDAAINGELSKFIARKMSDGKESADWSAEWGLWCLRWKDLKRAAPSGSAERIDETSLDWDAQLARFKRGQPWATKYWGPEPNQLGCRAPPELLAKHGFTQAH